VAVAAMERPAPLTFERGEFLHERFHYNPGEHVTIIGPTGSGKTFLGFQLAQVAAKPDLPVVVLVIKPKDETVDKWAKTLKLRIVKDWPPAFWWTHILKPKGYVAWPRHTFDADVDDQRLAKVMKRVLNWCYKHGNTIVFTDEIYGLVKELELDRQVNAILSRGRGMGCGLWEASQRPYNMPQLGYSGAEHLFLARDPDDRDRERFGEIGGVDPKYLEAVVMQLPKFHWLYIRRTGEDPNSTEPAMCIVGK
jgi:hypothetical protein